MAHGFCWYFCWYKRRFAVTRPRCQRENTRIGALAKLTDIQLRQAKPGEKAYKLSEGDAVARTGAPAESSSRRAQFPPPRRAVEICLLDRVVMALAAWASACRLGLSLYALIAGADVVELVLAGRPSAAGV